MALDLYRLEPRGGGRFDLVHFTREFIAGRWMTLREIVRADIATRPTKTGEEDTGHG